MALKNLRHMIGHTTLSCDVLENYSRQLDPFRANTPALTNVIKLEYQLQSKFLNDMASGKGLGITNQSSQLAHGVLNKPFFNTGKTRNQFAQFARHQLESISRNLDDMPENPIMLSTNNSAVKLLLTGNAVGEILVRLTLPAQERFIAKKCLENVNVAATQTTIALKCYQQKHGRLPERLDELVPEFLTSVTVDDYDGEPLRYSAEKKIIYSVGADLIDSNGQTTNSLGKNLDIPFSINF
jgi:hypothetical protein